VENKNSFYSIVFQNEHFVVVDKAADVLSVPSRMGEDEARPVLGLILEKDLGKTIYPVHRLDYEVQGLIMYAFTPAAHKAGNVWFEQKIVSKKYSALTASAASNEFQTGVPLEWKCRLLRGKKRAYESPHGKDSLTIATLVSIDSSGYFHWELSPVTGRSHQLRYELFRHGMPIVGDQLYGSELKFNQEGIALRSFMLDFSKAKNRDEFSLPEKIVSKTF
jgi:tRNA pseudouridine32 synthase/23S rRNA pseudouridine746 synthase